MTLIIMMTIGTMTTTEQPKGLSFRWRPFFIAIMYPRTHSPAQRLAYLLEIVREDLEQREAFGVKEVGA